MKNKLVFVFSIIFWFWRGAADSSNLGFAKVKIISANEHSCTFTTLDEKDKITITGQYIIFWDINSYDQMHPTMQKAFLEPKNWSEKVK